MMGRGDQAPSRIFIHGGFSVRPLPGGEGGHLPRDPCPMQARNRNVPIHLKMIIATLHFSTGPRQQQLWKT